MCIAPLLGFLGVPPELLMGMALTEARGNRSFTGLKTGDCPSIGTGGGIGKCILLGASKYDIVRLARWSSP